MNQRVEAGSAFFALIAVSGIVASVGYFGFASAGIVTSAGIVASAGIVTSAGIVASAGIVVVASIELNRLVTTAALEVHDQEDIYDEHGDRKYCSRLENVFLGSILRLSNDLLIRIGNLGRIDTLILNESKKFFGLGSDNTLMNRGIRRFDAGADVIVLNKAEPGTTEDSNAHHTETAHHVEGQSAAAWELFRYHSQRCWPEKSLADTL